MAASRPPKEEGGGVITGVGVLRAQPKLLGYNVYRFADGGFVPKESLNDEPLTTTSYRDTKDRGAHTWHYLVRGVFLVQGRVVEGPMSQIA